MAYDEIIVGSSLSALGVALGLIERGRRVLCLAGPREGTLRTYAGSNVPREYLGIGGLGKYWHGVVPLALSTGFPDLQRGKFEQMLSQFHPGVPLSWLGSDRLFVPYRPVRPHERLLRLATERANFTFCEGVVTRVERRGTAVDCHVGTDTHSAERVWLCCGALGTPRLLAASGLINYRQRIASDHVIGYAGLVPREALTKQLFLGARRVRGGIVLPCSYSDDRGVMYMLRPARFDFARLDEGFEKRAVFGLPASRILAGLAGRLSPGLIAEALYNKFGLFGSASLYSVNFIAPAHRIERVDDGHSAPFDPDIARAVVESAVARAPFKHMRPTRRPDLFIPGVHLHASLDKNERRGFISPSGDIRIVDASIHEGIGPEHHSFKMMAAAYQAASAD